MIETKYCNACGKVIPINDEICPECGIKQTVNMRCVKNPGIAAILSCIFPGLGQLYNQEIIKGLKIIGAMIISMVLIVILIGFITMPIIWLYSIWDAYTTADEINDRGYA